MADSSSKDFLYKCPYRHFCYEDYAYYCFEKKETFKCKTFKKISELERFLEEKKKS